MEAPLSKNAGLIHHSTAGKERRVGEIPAEAQPGGTAGRWMAAKCFLNGTAVLRL